MEIFAILLITGVFAALGFFIALKLCPDRRTNRDKFLMTALLCVALAIVASGLVRKPVVKYLRATAGPASITEALQHNELFALVRQAAPDVAEAFQKRALDMTAQAKAEGMDLSLSDWDVSVILWEKLVPGGVGIAPDKAAVQFAHGLSERLHTLLAEDPNKALALLSPRSFAHADPAIFALTGAFGKGVKAVVMGAYQKPVPLYEPKESAQIFASAMQDFVARLTQDTGTAPDLSAQLALLENPASLPSSGKAELASTIAAMLDFVLTRPAQEQAILVKHIFSGPEE